MLCQSNWSYQQLAEKQFSVGRHQLLPRKVQQLSLLWWRSMASWWLFKRPQLQLRECVITFPYRSTLILSCGVWWQWWIDNRCGNLWSVNNIAVPLEECRYSSECFNFVCSIFSCSHFFDHWYHSTHACARRKFRNVFTVYSVYF